MSEVSKAVIQTAVKSFVTVTGQGLTFRRVLDQINRINKEMPDNTGKEKRAQFLADCTIIFDEMVVPFTESFLRGMLELAIIYMTGTLTKKS